MQSEAPIKRVVRQLEDDASDLVFNVCESLGGAGTEAKWENEFKEARSEFVPNTIVSNDEVMKKISDAAIGAWNALLIRDYARIDMRLTADGTPYVIEVNPNPWLDQRAEFAMVARKAKPEMSCGDVIERIVELAMEHPIHERTAQ